MTTANEELDGTSDTAEYGPPYNHNGSGQHIAFVELQKWLGVSHPIDTANDYVIDPLRSVPGNPALQSRDRQLPAAPSGHAEAPGPKRMKRRSKRRHRRPQRPGAGAAGRIRARCR